MKKIMALLMGSLLLGSCCFAACTEGGDPTPDLDPDPDPPIEDPSLDGDSFSFIFNEMYSGGEILDRENGFSGAEDVTSGKFFVNGAYQTTFTEFSSRQDVKLELYNDSAARIVNVSAGIAFTLPATEITADYTIAQYRTQYSFGDSVLTVSSESSNPYTANPNPWYTYCSEWLIRHVNNDTFLSNNGLVRLNNTRAYDFTETNSVGDLTIKPGYDVYRFDIQILDESGSIERPYYNIAVIREESDVRDFALFVMKSSSDQAAVMDEIVQSFNTFRKQGLQRNYFDAGEPTANPNWNAETKAYYEQLTAQDHVSWGVFTWSMPGNDNQLLPTSAYTEEQLQVDSIREGAAYYDTILRRSIAYQEGIEEAWGQEYEIYPTYTHIGWGSGPDNYTASHFPLAMARELAGGNGTNGKPVLQFTYQFTLNNNIVADEVTPMFDILRGEYDEQFRRLARDIKEYAQPVLFRLNNEMNTDWTSYCGMMTLLDPDIFIMTWQRLYDIFEEEGVDNAIWIWNPIATSCPYSSWGEDLCFFPGTEYAQILGGTSYEMNNYDAAVAAESIVSFEEHYSSLYDKNEAAFSQWSMVISEFACGSGGNAGGTVLGRNAAVQAQWVEDMFACLNAEDKPAWVSQIKGAVWFNCNDGSGNAITNRLQFFAPEGDDSGRGTYTDLLATLEAFRNGFAAGKN